MTSVTVVALCYNHAGFVTDALESIKDQSRAPEQVLVIDDFSTDDSVAIVKAFIDEHRLPWTVLAHATNRGVCRSLNDGIRLATGDLVMMLATDDFWSPARVESHVAAFEGAPPSTGVVYSNAAIVDTAGRPTGATILGDNGTLRNPPQGNVLPQMMRRNFVPGMAATVRRACFDTVGKFDEALVYEDWDMFLRLAAHFEFRYVPGSLANYRVLSGSLHRTRRTAMLQSDLEMFRRWIGQPGEIGRQAREQLSVTASMLAIRDAARSERLREAWGAARTPRSVAGAFAATIGVDVWALHDRYLRARAAWRRVKAAP